MRREKQMKTAFIKLRGSEAGLRPCPFCGREPELIRDQIGYIGMWSVRCACGIHVMVYDAEYDRECTRNAWNRRMVSEDDA